MTLRAYLTLIRPWRTIVATAILLFASFVFLVAPMGVSLSDFAFTATCLILPLTTGVLLVTPLYEAAHRSGFPLLPDAGRRLLRSHLVAVSLAAILLGGLAALCVTTIPAPATFGLILVCLALPMVDSTSASTVGCSARAGLLLVAVLILAIVCRAELAALSRATPWLLFATGIAVTIGGFLIGFAPARLRARSANPFYYAPQSTLLFVGTDILQHAQTEASRLAEKRRSHRSADWVAPNFKDTLRDWLHVAHHARFGSSRLSRSEFSVFAAALVGTVITFPIGILGYAGPDIHQWEAYCRLAVAAAITSGEIVNSDVRQIFIFAPQVGSSVALFVAIVAAVPAGSFPLARSRLADVLFLSFERRALLALAGSAVGTALLWTAIAAIAGTSWEPALLQRFIPLPSLALATINTIPVALFSRSTGVRIGFGLLVFPGYIIATIAVLFRDTGSPLSPVCAILCTALVLGSVAFAWSTFRRHYRTCDLNHASDCLRRLGFRLG